MTSTNPTNPPRRLKLALFAAAATLIGGATVFGGLLHTATAQAPSATAKTYSAEEKAGIEKIIREYLLANPEVLLEVQMAYESKMEKLQAEKIKTAIKSNADQLYRNPTAPAVGAKNADITVVEFFDYNCGFCKRGFNQVAELIESDKKVRVVFKELPILSKGSEEAARVALASQMQGKYWEVHGALLKHRASVDGATALKIAGKLGLDIDKLKKDMNSEPVTAELTKVRNLAQEMGINGTPHFLVGDRTIPGAPENLHEQLAGHIKDLRKNGCEVC
ncbi:MAG: DsbA family protein [Filomicrobium sp.]